MLCNHYSTSLRCKAAVTTKNILYIVCVCVCVCLTLFWLTALLQMKSERINLAENVLSSFNFIISQCHSCRGQNKTGVVLAEAWGGSCIETWWGDECQAWWFTVAAETVYWGVETWELILCERIYHSIREISVWMWGCGALQTNRHWQTVHIQGGLNGQHDGTRIVVGKNFKADRYIYLSHQLSLDIP